MWEKERMWVGARNILSFLPGLIFVLILGKYITVYLVSILEYLHIFEISLGWLCMHILQVTKVLKVTAYCVLEKVLHRKYTIGKEKQKTFSGVKLSLLVCRYICLLLHVWLFSSTSVVLMSFLFGLAKLIFCEHTETLARNPIFPLAVSLPIKLEKVSCDCDG